MLFELVKEGDFKRQLKSITIAPIWRVKMIDTAVEVDDARVHVIELSFFTPRLKVVGERVEHATVLDFEQNHLLKRLELKIKIDGWRCWIKGQSVVEENDFKKLRMELLFVGEILEPLNVRVLSFHHSIVFPLLAFY